MAQILIIDDDIVFLRALRAALAKAGHRVTAARNGTEALDLANKEFFQIILSDVNMPNGLSGFNLGTLLKKSKKYSDVPIIFLTGRNERTDVLTALESGADDYFIKPINYEKLIAKVDTLLKRKNVA